MQYNLTYDCQSVENGQTRKADYYFEQLEHGGGSCNCVDIDFICDQQNRYEIFSLIKKQNCNDKGIHVCSLECPIIGHTNKIHWFSGPPA